MLGNPEVLAVGEVFIVSLIGLCTVFLCLGCLILAIKVMGLIFSNMGSKKPQPAAAGGAPAPEKLDEETYAVLLSAVSAEIGLPLEKFRITSITEKK